MPEKTGLTNAGKKEERQYGQILDKSVKEGSCERDGVNREVESRTVPKQDSTRKRKSK
jgi:hypothetical protein